MRSVTKTLEHSNTQTLDSGDQGYTILEVVVALALLVTVLVPASALMVHFMTRDTISSRMEAVALGQSLMEQGIGEGTCAAAEQASDTGRWVARRSASSEDGLCTIDVRVYRTRSERVVYHFVTKRE